MKVCTDACLFGAMVADTIHTESLASSAILDIGTGTGLLALMLCQKTHTQIDTVEIDSAAVIQAEANIAASPFSDYIKVHHLDIKQFNPDKKFDIIISNPPFFEGDLKSNDSKINKARHDNTLTLQQLIEKTASLLCDEGFFAVLLPYHRVDYFEKLANEHQLFLSKQFLIKQTPNHPFFRGVLIFSTKVAKYTTKEIVIKTETGLYSDDFMYLLKDYYL